jgi:hypothetical protein
MNELWYLRETLTSFKMKYTLPWKVYPDFKVLKVRAGGLQLHFLSLCLEERCDQA